MVRALPDMANAATDDELRDAFWTHLQETEGHIKRLEDLLATIKTADPGVDSIEPIKCKAISGLRSEAEDMMTDARDAFVKDAALIAAAQRVEHYEIAAYGAVREYARAMGDLGAAEILDKTLQEEGNADHLLTRISERINVAAVGGRDVVNPNRADRSAA
jgi:ferritin-like metal-binding protein YciE